MAIQTRSSAIQNEFVRLYCTFIRNGSLTNPASQPIIEITDSDGITVLDTVHAQEEHTGIWYADWVVPPAMPLGDYYDKWYFQWSATGGMEELTMLFTVHSLDNYINNFLDKGISIDTCDRVVQLQRDLNNDFIFEAQHINNYWEEGMRIRQENQDKRIKNFYDFQLDRSGYVASEGAKYTNNGQIYTITATLRDYDSSSSDSSMSSIKSSFSSSSSTNTISSSSSSSSISSSSSSESSGASSFSSSSSSSSSESSNSSSSSSGITISGSSTSSLTTEDIFKPILTSTGTGDPATSGILTKVSGHGDDAIIFGKYSKTISRFSTVYNCAYKNWLHEPRPIVRLNNRIVDDGWHVDYDGNLYFDGLMSPEDSISVKYGFSYFSEDELLSFLKLGLQMMNSVPPASESYTSLCNAPTEWHPGILLYAAVTAMRRLIFGLNWQERAVIFARPDDLNGANQAIQNFKDLYNEYNETWTEFGKNVKTRKLPGIALSIQPEYTLPGGRCMSSDTFINCRIEGKECGLTIAELYGIFEKGESVEVLSMNSDLKIQQASVSKIWKSGKKLTYIVKAGEFQIRLSEDHLVYLPQNETYKPVSDLVGTERILVLEDDSLVEKQLDGKPYPYKTEQVFDIEVPSTENFVGNNIVSHNSRFFRYLFKGGS